MTKPLMVQPNACSSRPHLIVPDLLCIPITKGGAFVLTNCYALGPAGGDWLMVDTGAPGTAEQVLKAVVSRHGCVPPKAIVLTHAHFDHAGNAEYLARKWDVLVYAHRLDEPYLSGRAKLPPLDPTVGGFVTFMSRFFPESAFDLGEYLAALPGDGSIPGFPELKWIATPGHTPGHVSLLRERDRLLLAGDAVITVNQDRVADPLTLRQEMRGPSTFATSDWQAAEASARLLAELEPLVVASGHGEPMVGPQVPTALRRLAADFDRVSVPKFGRYAERPVRADENGLKFVPPPPPDRLLQLAIIGGVAGIALAVLAASVPRRRSRDTIVRARELRT